MQWRERRLFEYFAHAASLLLTPVMDRRRGRLVINAVHLDPGPPMPASVGREVAGAIRELARFLGASETDFSADVPAEWRRQLR